MIWKNVSVAVFLAFLNVGVFKLFSSIGLRNSPLSPGVGLALYLGIAHAQAAHLGMFATLAPSPAVTRLAVSFFMAAMVAFEVAWPFARYLNDGANLGLAFAASIIGHWFAIQPILHISRRLFGDNESSRRTAKPREWQIEIRQGMTCTVC